MVDLRHIFNSLLEGNFTFGAATFGDNILVLRSFYSCYDNECKQENERNYGTEILRLSGGVLVVIVFFILLTFLLAFL